MSTDIQNMSLNGLYYNTKCLWTELQALDIPSNNSEYQAKLEKVLLLLDECKERCDKLALFSENETLSDVQTNTIEFLLIPSYQANALLKKEGDRIQIISKAKTLLMGFVEKCFSLEIPDSEDELYYKKSLTKAKSSAEKSRAEKIERYKAEKALKDKIHSIKNMLDSAPKNKPNKIEFSNQFLTDFTSGVRTINFSAGQTNNSSSNNIEDGENYEDDLDSDIVREHLILLIKLQVKLEIENIIMINNELELLENFIKYSKMNVTEKNQLPDLRAPNRQSIANKDIDWKLDTNLSSSRGGGSNSGRLLDSKGKPTKTFVITDQKIQTKKGVFQPGYSLPTKSIEQFIDEEFERGNVITGGGKEPPENILDEDDEDAVDAETMKQRKWDEFTDDVVKGSGNSSNRG
ncbi:hypothetical protein BB561_004180 [Smittium simulii]|uniref:TAP42-like protein n=1 Tax=Smittium simulii TaxID=133385 RepID=A0A2T9YHP6_9FUNG|nr:hypothetical protein BB561_004180 [Smittium simulii]